MSINYYFSGFDLDNKTFKEIEERIRKDIKETNQIVFVPGYYEVKKVRRAKNIYMPELIKVFADLDIHFKNIICITPNTNNDKVKDYINNSDVVFLMGGNPFHQDKFIKDKGIDKLLENYSGIIMGVSAGAMNMSRKVIITPCSDEYPDYDIRDGLTLSDISILPHFNIDGYVPEVIDCNDDLVKKKDLIRAEKEYGPFYCIQDYPTVSAIRTYKDKVEFLGGIIYKVEDGEFEKVNKF
jgi:dipeptidase E